MPVSPEYQIPLLSGGSDFPVPDEQADAKDINDALQYMEQFLGIGIFTSSTRPPTPKPRQMIYETDTGALSLWDGTQWVAILNKKQVITSGPGTLRDLIWGVPSTASARVALANQGVRWFNTDTGKGYEERYYSAIADASARLENSAKVGGWFPGGTRRPYVRLDYGRVSTSTLPTSIEIIIGNSNNYKWEESYDPHGWFDSAAAAGTAGAMRIIPKVPGYYKAFLHAQFNTAAGAYWGTIRLNSGTSSTYPYARAMGYNGSQVIGQPVDFSGEFSMNGTTDYLEATLWSTSSVESRGFMTVEYLGPQQWSWSNLT